MKLIRWDEPRVGMDADGKRVTVNVTLECTPDDAVRMMRKFVDQDEALLLEDFVLIHWARWAGEGE